MAAGVGRGLLGAVGLPLSGALDLVSGVASGIAASTGMAARPHLRRPPCSAALLLTDHAHGHAELSLHCCLCTWQSPWAKSILHACMHSYTS